MSIELKDGKWVTKDSDNPIAPFEYSAFSELGKKVSAVYGEKNITHDRINIISELQTLTPIEESALAHLLKDRKFLSTFFEVKV